MATAPASTQAPRVINSPAKVHKCGCITFWRQVGNTVKTQTRTCLFQRGCKVHKRYADMINSKYYREGGL